MNNVAVIGQMTKKIGTIFSRSCDRRILNVTIASYHFGTVRISHLGFIRSSEENISTAIEATLNRVSAQIAKNFKNLDNSFRLFSNGA